MKKILTLFLTISMLTLLSACGSFKAKRVSADESDDKASEITDKWVAKDTELTMKDMMEKLEKHKSFQDYLKKFGKKPKLFIGEVQNKTSEAYFPIDDFNEAYLDQLSQSGYFTLIDNTAREKILKEVQYQNDGMVDPAQAKMIGKQSGADLMIFGAIIMKPESRGGQTLKEYSINIRMTDIQSAEEVFRVRAKVNKYSQQKASGW